MVISHNLTAMNAQRQFNISGTNKGKSAEKLASGYKINRASDDAAGLTISEKMRWQVRGLNRASDNIQDGVSLTQTADGALNEASAILTRMKELSVQAANDTNTPEDRDAIQKEIDENIKEINRIAEGTSFNGIYPLRANDEFALDPTVSENVTPTQVQEGVYRMDEPNIEINANGINKNVYGFQLDLGESDISALDGKAFFVTCSANCNQIFEFSFDSSKASSATSTELKNTAGSESLFVTVGIGDNPSGEAVVNAIADAIKTSSLYDSVNDTATNDFMIGHANKLNVDGAKMVFYPLSGGTPSDYVLSTPVTVGGVTYPTTKTGCVYLNGIEENVNIHTTASKWGLKIQAGALQDQIINVPLVWMEASGMGIDPLDVSTNASAGEAITRVDNAINWMNSTRATFGAVQNRLEHAASVDDISSEKTSAAESQIRDTDMAQGMVDYSKQDILTQMGQAMIAQANQSSQSVLDLLL